MSEAPNVEQQASAQGWVPQDRFPGDAAKWVDAQTYLDRAETVMPILRKNNETLRQEVNSVYGKLTETQEALKQSTESIEELKKFHTEFTAQRVKDAKEKLLKELTAAKENENVADEVRLTDELGRLNAAEVAAAAEVKTTPKTEVRQPVANPAAEAAYVGWRERNTWMGADQEKTTYAEAVGLRLRREGDTSTGLDFLNKVAEQVNTFFSARNGNGSVDRVEGARHSGGGGGGGKSYADLPREAKDQVASQERSMVGKGKPFADMKSWQEYYAKTFFETE